MFLNQIAAFEGVNLLSQMCGSISLPASINFKKLILVFHKEWRVDIFLQALVNGIGIVCDYHQHLLPNRDRDVVVVPVSLSEQCINFARKL